MLDRTNRRPERQLPLLIILREGVTANTSRANVRYADERSVCRNFRLSTPNVPHSCRPHRYGVSLLLQG
jgi:hypothetical protein